MNSNNYDIIVMGGGPAGSAVATFVAMQGHKVLLLEREAFPRHQLGESLLPATVHGICPLLGVKDELAKAGFPRKRGGTFRWGKNPEPWTFTFSAAPNSPVGYAYQVERCKFDKILLDNAQRKGVEVLQRRQVSELLSDGGRVSGVRFTDDDGRAQTATAKYVVDAGGHRGRWHEQVGERVYSRFFQNVALYAYFENGLRLPPPNDGNILCCAFNDGWFWYIPLSKQLTSVGAVVSREAAEKMKEGNESAFNAFVDQCPMIKKYLGSARRVTEGMYGEYRVRKDYSYCNTKFWRPGLVLIGDAACFIDPVFSSGVHLATYSALLAARSINTLLAGRLEEARCFDEFEKRYRREFGNFYQFLLAFYDVHRDENSYFWEARKILQSGEKESQAFVRLVAGLSSDDEPTFDSRQFFSERAGLGEWLERFVNSGAEKPGAAKSFSDAFKDKADSARFMRGFTDEITQLQLQAMFGQDRPAEAPLTPVGLVPSRDGFHWA